MPAGVGRRLSSSAGLRRAPCSERRPARAPRFLPALHAVFTAGQADLGVPGVRRGIPTRPCEMRTIVTPTSQVWKLHTAPRQAPHSLSKSAQETSGTMAKGPGRRARWPMSRWFGGGDGNAPRGPSPFPGASLPPKWV